MEAEKEEFKQAMALPGGALQFLAPTAQGQRPEGLPGAGHRVWRMVMASDGHYGYQGSDYTTAFSTFEQAMVQERDGQGVDLLFLNGDLIHDKPEYLKPVQAMVTRLGIPCRVGRGNHDRVPNAQWQAAWGHPPAYRWCQGSLGFVVAETTFAPNWAYEAPPREWLQRQLKALQNCAMVFVFLHITPKAWTKYGANHGHIADLLAAQPNVAAVFHGHDHMEAGHKLHGRLPFLWDGCIGGVPAEGTRGYRILEVYQASQPPQVINSASHLQAFTWFVPLPVLDNEAMTFSDKG